MEKTDTILAGLNERQHEAVVTLEGPLLVLAGAGSGKTRVLTSRIARAISLGFARPEEIFAVTFTNKAAASMRRRVGEMAGCDFSRLWVRTFHSACAVLLRIEHEALRLPRDFTIYDQDDQTSLVRAIIKDQNFAVDAKNAGLFVKLIQRAKDALVDPADFSSDSRDPKFAAAVKDIYRIYNERLRQNGALDFGDLIMETVRLLRHEDRIRKKYADRFRLVLVDEFQDTNEAQYELVKMLAGTHRNACVVGDDDQSIYSWRGACVENFSSFVRDFDPVHTVRLEQNYRSSPEILDVAARVIANNGARMEKRIWSDLPGGDRPLVIDFARDRDEASWIAGEIRRAADSGARYSDIAIFYRANWQSRVFEETFLARKIPYQLVGSLRFYERKEIRDLVAWLRLVVNPRDGGAFQRAMQAPARGIGEKSVQALQNEALAAGLDLVTACRTRATTIVKGKAKAAELVKVAAAIDNCDGTAPDLAQSVSRLVKASGLEKMYAEDEDRMANIGEFINGLASWQEEHPEGTLADFIAEISLLGELDQAGASGEGVFLMTIHNAKGLEFERVYLTGLEDGVFPHYLSLEEPGRLEEERRLFYVGVTRAKRHLTLCHAEARYSFGREMHNAPSRFLEEIPAGLLVTETGPRQERIDQWRSTGTAATGTRKTEDFRDVKATLAGKSPIFAEGDKVRHKDYGEGVVLERKMTAGIPGIRVAFADRVCTFIEMYAALERIP